jgi:hypothetical protein
VLQETETNRDELVTILTPEERQYKEISEKVKRLAEITGQIKDLELEQDVLEGYFLKLAEKDLADTKLKTATYDGPDGTSVSATMTKSLKLVYPTYLKLLFGEAYKDAVTEETKYKVSAPASRMLVGLWQKEYLKSTIAEIINQITPDPELRKVLSKKVKGASFPTDKKNLMAICGFDEKAAEEYAYFISEAAVWQSFLRLLKVQGLSEDAEKQYLDWIDGAVVVEENPKITIVTTSEDD